MKKIIYLSTTLALVFTMACGGNATKSEVEKAMDDAEEAIEEAEYAIEEAEKTIEKAKAVMPDLEDFTEREITAEEIPQNVKDVVKDMYPEAEITEADEQTGPSGNVVYSVEIVKDGKEKDLIITAEGTYLGEEKEWEEEDVDDDENEDEGDDDD